MYHYTFIQWLFFFYFYCFFVCFHLFGGVWSGLGLLLWMDIRKHLRIHLQTEICKPWIYAGTLPADLRFGSNYDACGIHAVSG